MEEITDFERDYFIQTRREIDTEKRERDHILNFAVVILGALGFAVVQSERASEFIAQPISFLLEGSVLAILTSLFWVRWMKLRQIADRWYTLHWILTHRADTDGRLETLVIDGFKQKRYIKKDITLCLTLSLPIYCLVVMTALSIPFTILFSVIIPILLLTAHILFSLKVLCCELSDPFEGTRCSKTEIDSELPDIKDR